jgi:hypothetical protein
VDARYYYLNIDGAIPSLISSVEFEAPYALINREANTNEITNAHGIFYMQPSL